MKKIFIILLIIPFSIIHSQNNSIYHRLQVLHNSGTTYFNIDGYSISKDMYNYEFTEKNLKKVTRKYTIKRKDKKNFIDNVDFKNICVYKQEEIEPNLTQHNSYYFIENKDKRISVIWFSKINEKDVEFEKQIVSIIVADTIPKECYTTMKPDSINFAGRKIKLDNSCYWTYLNTVQCPYNGEMNWSVHSELRSAQNSINAQKELTKAKKGINIVSEESVPIIFEEQETVAQKLVFSFKGIKSFLAGVSNGETLTVYYVATKVRGNYVSCVLSHWNNDNINASGLPALLEEVMELKLE